MSEKATLYDRLDAIHDQNIDPETRTIYMVGRDLAAPDHDPGEPGVEYQMASQFIKNLRFIQSQAGPPTYSYEPIVIHMKTCGGDWMEGMAIYDAIKTCKAHVTIVSYTHARSMSSVILQAADHRVLMPHSTFMFHMGTADVDGTGTQFDTEHEQYRIARNQMLDIYVNAARGSDKYRDADDGAIRRSLIRYMQRKEEVYLGAAEAVTWGFADRVHG